MNCRFCGSVANPKWLGGYSCGTINDRQSGICVALIANRERIVMVADIESLKSRIATLESSARALLDVIDGDVGDITPQVDALRGAVEAKP